MAYKKSKSKHSSLSDKSSKLQRDSTPFIGTVQDKDLVKPVDSSFDTPLQTSNFQVASILPQDAWLKNLILFVKSELNISGGNGAVQDDNLEGDESLLLKNDDRTERILNFLEVPFRLEIFTWFGYLVCLDSFLHIVTILPLKIVVILFNLVHYYIMTYFFKAIPRRGGFTHLSQQQKSDLLNGLLIISSCILLQNIDASRLYHSIRGQAIIKLYVIFNALEICDKLASAFGHDILDSLHSYSPQMKTKFNRFLRFLLALAYTYGHTLVLFYLVMSLNVAINSYNNALLTLLISNQFVEIKGSVFKRFEKGNLFQLSCADSVERFQLSVFLIIVTIRNCIEIFGSGAFTDLTNALMYYTVGFRDIVWALYEFKNFSFSISSVLSFIVNSNEFKLAQIVFGPYVMVLGTEIVVDWVKHAFIVKFNGLKPSVYDRFIESICKDILGIKDTKSTESGGERKINPDDMSAPIKHDRSPTVSKRIGFVSIPLVCLSIRIGYQLLQIIGAMPETLISEKGWSPEDNSFDTSSEPVEDESIGSWRLPLKLATWIKSRRSSFEKAGFSMNGFSFFAPLFWIFIFFILILFKIVLGIILLHFSRNYLMRKKISCVKEYERDHKLDHILNVHTPHHMLPSEFMDNNKFLARGDSSISLDQIDRFSMVKSRIP